MKNYKIDNMVKGWFIGNFSPTIINTKDVEVAVKYYSKDDYDSSHYHKIATEITVIINGSAEMNGVVYKKGDIIEIEPNDITDFKVLEDNTITVVVKIPGIINDKFIV